MTALDPQFGSYRRILVLAGPLILSQTSVMVMQIIDGLMLAWYAKDAVEAMTPAGLGFWAVVCLFVGMAGYTSTFVAQYLGAQRPSRVGPTLWQGVYLSLAGGALLMLGAPLAGPIFHSLGLKPVVADLAATYFGIFCLGAPLFILNASLSGFFSGRHDNVTLMLVQVLGCAVNVVLDWVMIFGRLGLPEMGIAGAAWATVIAQVVMVLVLAALCLRPNHRRTYATWTGRRLDRPLLARMIRYGAPNGLRMLVEILAWTLFTVFIGRISDDGLAATGIVFRLNTMAFFPIIGLSIAVAVLVGQAQGAHRPDLSARVVWRGLLLSEIWMAVAALVFVLLPGPLMDLFLQPSEMSPDQIAVLRDLGMHLLRFVAIYTLMDAANVVVLGGLQGAGDTRWTMLVSGTAHLGFLLLLLALDRWGRAHVGVSGLWTLATIFVMLVASLWIIRFQSGRWRTMRVIEPAPPDILPDVSTSARPE